MKKIILKNILFVLLWLSYFFPVYAQDNIPAKTDKLNNIELGDLIYFPGAGQLSIRSNFTNENFIGSADYNSARMMEMNSSSKAIGLNLGFGITKNIAISMKNEYLIGENSETNYISSSLLPDKTTSKGFKDPTFSLSWHLIEDKSLVFALSGEFSPKMMNSKGANSQTKAEGDAGRGYPNISADFMLGYKYKNIVFGIDMGYSYNFAYEGQTKDSSNTSDYDAGYTTVISPALQIILAHIDISFLAGIVYLSEGRSISKSSGIVKSTNIAEAIMGTAVAGKFGVRIIPDRIYWDIGYSKMFPIRQKLIMTQNGTQQILYTIFEENIFSTSITFVLDTY